MMRILSVVRNNKARCIVGALCLLLLLSLAFLLSGEKKVDATPEQLAAQAAKQYYDRLLAGDYDAFLAGRADADALPADYREQMKVVCRQFIEEQKAAHGGIAEVTVTNAHRDSTLQLTHAFLLLHFGDSTKEEVTVAMVERAGVWKMK